MTWLALLLASAVTATQGPDPRVAWVLNPRTTSGSWVSDVGGRLQPATVTTLNTLIDEANAKLVVGKPVSLAIRDDLSADEFQKILRETGVMWHLVKLINPVDP